MKSVESSPGDELVCEHRLSDFDGGPFITHQRDEVYQRARAELLFALNKPVSERLKRFHQPRPLRGGKQTQLGGLLMVNGMFNSKR